MNFETFNNENYNLFYENHLVVWRTYMYSTLANPDFKPRTKAELILLRLSIVQEQDTRAFAKIVRAYSHFINELMERMDRMDKVGLSE